MDGRLNGSTYRMMETESDRILHSMINTLQREMEGMNKDVEEVKGLLRWTLGLLATLFLTIIGAMLGKIL